MSLLRLIARLDIKGPNLIKGVQLEGLRVIGNPHEYAMRYSEDADELLYLDSVASLYGRNQLVGLLERTTEGVFIPITVGGGIKSKADVRRLLEAGADKVALNTAAMRNPSLIRELSDAYGSQAIVVHIEAKKTDAGWECLTDCGREKTGVDARQWADEAVKLGAGEILITSIDKDGTRKGFDVELISAIAPESPVPVTACGGMWTLEHAVDVLENGRADAIAMASCLHYGNTTIKEIRDGLTQRKLRDKGQRAA